MYEQLILNQQATKHEQGTKHDDDKPALAYLPPDALMEVGKAFTYGAKKYGAWNHAKGLSISRCVAGALRHTFQFMAGESHDAESGCHHLASAVANLLMALQTFIRKPEFDDRFYKGEGK